MRSIRPSPGTVFVALSLGVALILPILSFDFGITEDEQLHNQHGKSILDYFLGTSDRAGRWPLDDDGRLEFEYDAEMNDLSGALNIYGGFFDLLCVATHRWVSPLGEFENRHLVNSLFGVLLIVSTGAAAARAAGWRAGILALLMMALSPRIIGHSMNNPVDVPFAALYMFSLCFMIRFLEELPRPSWKSWFPLLIGIALATDVRIAGLVLLCYLGLFVLIWCGAHRDPKTIGRVLGVTALLAGASYLLVSVLWPLAHRNPFTTPLLAFKHLSRLETFNAYDLFEGRWINDWEIPWYFVPKWLLIGTPLFVPLGLLLSPILVRAWRSRWKSWLIGFAFVFPVLFAVLRGSNVYNDARHLLFAYPPLVAFCAVVFENVLAAGRTRIPKLVFTAILAVVLAEPLAFMVRNHPNQGVYFSPTIGGVRGAWMRYETDFWGNSVREAVEWIQANAEPGQDGPLRIRLWYGDQTKGSYYMEKIPGFVHVVAAGDSVDWDYQILQTVECKYVPNVLAHWPPAGTVYEVKADGTPLAAVVVNGKLRTPDETLRAMTDWARRSPSHAVYYRLSLMLDELGRHEESADALRKAAELDPEPVGRTHDEYLWRSLELYRQERFEESVLACRLALVRDPDSARAHGDLCASYLALKQWKPARQACEAALRLDPEHEAARSNLAWLERHGRSIDR